MYASGRRGVRLCLGTRRGSSDPPEKVDTQENCRRFRIGIRQHKCKSSTDSVFLTVGLALEATSTKAGYTSRLPATVGVPEQVGSPYGLAILALSSVNTQKSVTLTCGREGSKLQNAGY